MNLCLSNQEKNFIIDGVQEGLRNDGRGVSDYRPIFLETNVLSTTNGSAKVQIESTIILVGVKAEMTTVEDSTTCVNRLRFFVDCSAVASPLFAGKGGSVYGEEIAKILADTYDNDEVIPNLAKLILGKTYMWTIFVDIVILQYGGSVMDAASIGVKAALASTEICEMIVRPADEGKLILDLPDECNTWCLDMSRAPLIISVNKVGESSVVDVNEYEEACSTSTLFVAVESPEFELDNEEDAKDDCRIVCVRKHKGGCLDLESIDDMLNIAVHVARPLNKALISRLRLERARLTKQAELDASSDQPPPPLLNILFR